METKVDIRLGKKSFEARKKDYLNAYLAEDPNAASEDYDYVIKPGVLETDEMKYKNGSIVLVASMFMGGEFIGCVSVDIPLESDILSEILEAQVKKYNKIKTIIEATK